MNSLTITPIIYKGENRIRVSFLKNTEWNNRIKKVPGSKWSNSLRSWHIPDTADNRLQCKLPLQQMPQQIIRQPVQAGKINILHMADINKPEMQKFLQHLYLHAYSASTIKTYRNEFAQLLQLLGNVSAQNLQPYHLQRYLLYCRQQGLSENALHSRINALKYYYEQVLHKEKMFFDIPRPKKHLMLPGVFSKEEITGMINSISNLKQKIILMLTYACGLRVSEAVSIKISDIDGKRMVIHLHAAKGKKDRLVNLSPVLLVMLREYYKQYNPKTYLFEGQHPGEHYTIRSIQLVLQAAKQKANISKPGGMHLLRHSFATHLIDKGIDVIMIQKLLGHNDIKTTMRYLHVTNRDLQKVISPFEDIAGSLTKPTIKKTK